MSRLVQKIQQMETRRQELGMSRLALARRSRVSLATVNRILSGKHKGGYVC